MWNLFKVNYRDTRTASLTSFWCLYCKLWTYFTPFSSVSNVDFEQANVCWDTFHQSLSIPISLDLSVSLDIFCSFFPYPYDHILMVYQLVWIIRRREETSSLLTEVFIGVVFFEVKIHKCFCFNKNSNSFESNISRCRRVPVPGLCQSRFLSNLQKVKENVGTNYLKPNTTEWKHSHIYCFSSWLNMYMLVVWSYFKCCTLA